jgi:hypothetical protein
MDRWIPLLPGTFIIVLFGIFGYVIKYRKAYWLISGYNTMPEDKKKNVDTESLGRFMGNSLFTGCGIVAVAMVFFVIGISMAGFIVLGLLLPGIVYTLIGSQKFDRNAIKPDGKYTPRTKWIITGIILFFAIVCGGVAILLSQGAKPAKFSVNAGNLEIQCMFGETVPVKDISSLELVQALPEISTRTNGSAMGDTLRGSFLLADGTPARIFTENAKPPFIHFTKGTTAYFINSSTPGRMDALYADLQAALKP